MLKELDLQKFIHRQRLWTTSLIGLLNGRQTMFVNKMSQLVIRESSDSQNTSEDHELSDQGHDEINHINKMMHSGSQVDKRLIELFKVRQADQKSIRMSQNNIWKDQEMKRQDSDEAQVSSSLDRRENQYRMRDMNEQSDIHSEIELQEESFSKRRLLLNDNENLRQH